VVAVTFWPSGFDPRSEVKGFLRLADIDAPSGLARFMIGTDGVFTDTSGNSWVGSQLIEAAPPVLSRDGTAPEASITLSYFQDPDAGDLIDEIKESGDIAIRGSRVRFFLQPIGEVEEFYAPVYPPVLRATRTAEGLRIEAQGDTVRKITLTLEGPYRSRVSRRGFFYTVDDHARLIGAANPSLRYMPTDGQVLEKLFG
jgi:hypothetical protein